MQGLKFPSIIICSVLCICIGCRTFEERTSIIKKVDGAVVLFDGNPIDSVLRWDDTDSLAKIINIESDITYEYEMPKHWSIYRTSNDDNHFALIPIEKHPDSCQIDTLRFTPQIKYKVVDTISIILIKDKKVSKAFLTDGKSFSQSLSDLVNTEQIKHIFFQNNRKTNTEETIEISAQVSEHPAYLFLKSDTVFVSTEAERFIAAEDASGMFSQLGNLESIDFSDCFSTNLTKNMCRMFAGCTNLKNVDLSGLDFSNAEYLAEMFKNCNSLVEVTLKGGDCCKVCNLERMFSGCKNLSKVSLNYFNVCCKGSSLKEMFLECSGLTHVSFYRFRTTGVENMAGMFNGCKTLGAVNVSEFSFESCLYTNFMFYDCKKLKIINLGNAYIPAKYTNLMFGNVFEQSKNKVCVYCSMDSWNKLTADVFSETDNPAIAEIK